MNFSVEVDNIFAISLPSVHPTPHVISPEDTVSNVDICPCLSEDKICMAISQIKNSKAPGADHICRTHKAIGGDECVCWLETVFDAIWQQESIPKDWKGQIFVPLHKKGSCTACDSYRGIALLTTPSKVFAKSILNCLKPSLFTLRILMEKSREYHCPLYICFIDLKKAYYDSLNHDLLWLLLDLCFNLFPKLLSILRALHADSTAAVRVYGMTFEEFPVTRGVCQGCVLVPTLFNLYFDVAIRLALSEHEGKEIKFAYLQNTHFVATTRFA